jgi:plasmid stabilization system protein ParE
VARKIVWTETALKSRIRILEYWEFRNKSKKYSIKLDFLFRKAISILLKYPNTGKNTELEGVKVKIIGHYLMFYSFTNIDLTVHLIFDSRQDLTISGF